MQGVLKGKKTYVVAVVGIVGFVGAYLVGDASLADTARSVLEAVLAITIRHGIATSGSNTQ